MTFELVLETFPHRDRNRVAEAFHDAPLDRGAQQLVLVGDAGGQREGRQVVLLAERHIHRVGNGQAVLQHIRPVRESFRDLGRGLEVEAPVVAHAVGVLAVLAQPDAQKHVVRVVVGGPQEMRVVGGDDGKTEFAGQPEDPLVHRVLAFRVVGLDLEVVTAGERVRVPARGFPGRLPAIGDEMAGDLAGHARGTHDQALGVPGQDLAVDAWTVVEALQIADRAEPDQVAVPDLIPREEHEVVVLLLGHAARKADGVGGRADTTSVAPVAGRDVGLHPDDRLEAGLARLFLEIPRAEQAAVVRDGERGHLELERAPDQVADPVRAVEERILAMRVQVNERHPVPALPFSR